MITTETDKAGSAPKRQKAENSELSESFENSENWIFSKIFKIPGDLHKQSL